ncbi:MAG: NUDIX hydrolase [Bacteroidales bacterium]|nr:NUDIX hydrolase [Bacteroidales bacterium]
MPKKRTYCPYCSDTLIIKAEGESLRDYCRTCSVFFYDNPLPVASVIVVKDRKLLLVKRKFDPQKGKWCLPSGFAETGESIEAAALRELHEETGITGKIIDFVCVDSAHSVTYGDLIFVTFEAEWMKGGLCAGDDADAVAFFDMKKLPQLAFESNTKAVMRYLTDKQEYWLIVDSFNLAKENGNNINTSFLSDRLVGLIEDNAEIIASRWLNDVRVNPSTPTYAKVEPAHAMERILLVLRQFRKWLSGLHDETEIRRYYRRLGAERKAEGFALSEILSAFSLVRKHIWEFALSQKMWTSTIDIYMSLELERRMLIFFDRASFYAARGFERGWLKDHPEEQGI